jgi:cell division protein FtsL
VSGVVNTGRGRRGGLGVFCLVLLGVSLGALGHVAVQMKTVEVAAALNREHEARKALLAEQRYLKSVIGQLRDPARLETLAREKLGMAFIEPTAIRVVQAGRPAGKRERGARP